MIERLVHLLQALAAPPAAQLAAYPELAERAGNIAGDFSDVVRLVVDCPQIHLEPDQRDALDRIERLLEGHADPQQASFWSEAEMRNSSTWAALRQHARAALIVLGVPSPRVGESPSSTTPSSAPNVSRIP